MMSLKNGVLIIEIPNSECNKTNSLKDKNLKSSVGEFYISTNKNDVDNVTNFLSINNSTEIKATINEEKLNVYFDEIEEKIEPYSKLFVDELVYYHKCIEDFYDEDDLKISAISFVLSAHNRIINASKYLNMPKKNSTYATNNKSFYGLLLGEVSNLIIEKNESGLVAYPKLRDNFNELIQNHFIRKYNKKAKKENEKIILPSLNEVEPPKNIKSYITKDTKGGKDDTVYVEKAKNCIALGDFGEELVLNYEKEKLGDNYVVKNVAKEGLHYDILSYDLENNCEKHIEVKTTRKNEKEPFHLSEREYRYLISSESNCTRCIYRVYYARQKNPKFFVISSDQIKEQVSYVINPTDYEVSKKQD